jgi:mannosyltransferase
VSSAMIRRPRSSRWLLLGLTWLAFALRVAGITAQSLWRDEVDALIFATRPLTELLSMFRQPGQNGPLFFLALRPWLAAVGQSEFALRFPSAMAGALAVPIIYTLVRRLVHDRQPATITALLMATAPYLIWYGQEAKMYAALTVLVPGSLLLTVEVARRGGWWRWVLLYIITSLCFYTHLLAALIVPVQALWLVILPSTPGRRLRRWLAVGLYLAALILPYLPLLRWQAPTWLSLTYQTGHPFVPLGDILLVLTSAFSRGVLPVERPITLLPYLLALVAGVLLWTLDERRRAAVRGTHPARVMALLLIWLLLPPLAVFGISLGMPLFTDRYLIWAMPAFLALAGLGVTALARTWRPLGWVTLAAILAFNLLSTGVQTVRPIKSDLRAAAGYIAAHRQADDRLVYQIPHIRYTFSYYASGYTNDRNEPNDPAFIGIDGLYTNNGMTEAEAADRMTRAIAGAEAVWLIASEASMWDQRGLTERWLVEHGTPTRHADFERVSVTRYELHP